MTRLDIIQARLELMGLCLRVMVKTGKPEYKSASSLAESAKELYKEITGDEWPYDSNNQLSNHL